MRLHKRLKQNKSLLPSNSTILLAISGGQDSMALLKLIIATQITSPRRGLSIFLGSEEIDSKGRVRGRTL